MLGINHITLTFNDYLVEKLTNDPFVKKLKVKVYVLVKLKV